MRLDLVLFDNETHFSLFSDDFSQKRVFSKTTSSSGDPPNDHPKCQEQPPPPTADMTPKTTLKPTNSTRNDHIQFTATTCIPELRRPRRAHQETLSYMRDEVEELRMTRCSEAKLLEEASMTLSRTREKKLETELRERASPLLKSSRSRCENCKK